MPHDLHDPLPLDLPLSDGEEIVYRTSAWWRPVGWLLLPFLVPLLWLWRRVSTDYVVTNQRIILTEGLITKNQQVIQVGRVQNVEIKQGMSGRMLGYGTVLVETAGERSASEIGHVDEPRALRDAILAQSAAATPPPA